MKFRGKNLPPGVAFSIGGLLALIGLAGPAYGQKPGPSSSLPTRTATFNWDKQLLRATFSYRDVISPPIVQKLSSGLPTIIALRAYILEAGVQDPVALAVRTCRVVYDLWDELYRIKLSGPGGERDLAVINVEGVLRQCAEVRDMPVVTRSLLHAGKSHFLGIVVDVNPVSPEMLEEMRHWVARPAGSTGIAPSDALFSSFVGLFVRQLGNSDASLRFKSQLFVP